MVATTTVIEETTVSNNSVNDALIVPMIKTALKNSTAFLNTTTPVPAPEGAEEPTNNSFLSKFYRLKQEKLSNFRPLSEFFDKNRFNMTSSFQLIVQRWNYNLQYFSSNYFIIMLGLILYSVLSNWFLLFTICFIFGGFYMISKLSNQEEPLQFAGVQCSTSKLYATYAFSSFFLLLFSGATGTLFWIIGASALIILGHAAVMEPGIEGDFADNQV